MVKIVSYILYFLLFSNIFLYNCHPSYALSTGNEITYELRSFDIESPDKKTANIGIISTLSLTGFDFKSILFRVTYISKHDKCYVPNPFILRCCRMIDMKKSKNDRCLEIERNEKIYFRYFYITLPKEMDVLNASSYHTDLTENNFQNAFKPITRPYNLFDVDGLYESSRITFLGFCSIKAIYKIVCRKIDQSDTDDGANNCIFVKFNRPINSFISSDFTLGFYDHNSILLYIKILANTKVLTITKHDWQKMITAYLALFEFVKNKDIVPHIATFIRKTFYSTI